MGVSIATVGYGPLNSTLCGMEIWVQLLQSTGYVADHVGTASNKFVVYLYQS
jgi:hypothetical protein